MSGEPARGPGRGSPAAPPFEAGNLLALRHGARSPRLVEADAAALLADLRAAGATWLQDLDGAAVSAWLAAEAAVRRLRSWVATHDLIDDRGKPRGAADLLLRYERQAARCREDLGLTPAARAQLRRAMAGLPAAELTVEAVIAAMAREAE